MTSIVKYENAETVDSEEVLRRACFQKSLDDVDAFLDAATIRLTKRFGRLPTGEEILSYAQIANDAYLDKMTDAQIARDKVEHAERHDALVDAMNDMKDMAADMKESLDPLKVDPLKGSGS